MLQPPHHPVSEVLLQCSSSSKWKWLDGVISLLYFCARRFNVFSPSATEMLSHASLSSSSMRAPSLYPVVKPPNVNSRTLTNLTNSLLQWFHIHCFWQFVDNAHLLRLKFGAPMLSGVRCGGSSCWHSVNTAAFSLMFLPSMSSGSVSNHLCLTPSVFQHHLVSTEHWQLHTCASGKSSSTWVNFLW